MSGETPLTARRALAARLRASGIADAALEARILIEAVTTGSAFDAPLGADAAATLADYERRRLAGEPVFRIIGEREFWGLPFRLSPGTLEPRSDSETLIDSVLACFGGRRAEPLRLLDLGTGSGCLLVAALHELTGATGVGLDRSPDAAQTARANARRNGVGARAAFVVGDWGDAIDARFDLVLSNPPYIQGDDIAGLAREVRDHDPHAALDGGRDGLDAYRSIAAQLPVLLAPGGRAILEIGAGQANDVLSIVTGTGLQSIEVRRDLGGHERALVFAHHGE